MCIYKTQETRRPFTYIVTYYIKIGYRLLHMIYFYFFMKLKKYI